MRRLLGGLLGAAMAISLVWSPAAPQPSASAAGPTPPHPTAAPQPFTPPVKPASGEVPKASAADVISSLAACTPRVALLVTSSARFNLGADPDASTCGSNGLTAQSWDLMYRWPNSPATSFATVQIDGGDWVYGSAGTMNGAPVTSGLSNSSSWWDGDVLVSQRLELVPNDTTGEREVLRVSYTVHNYGQAGHDVGVRSMIDTELDYNDGAIFRADGYGTMYYERQFWGSEIPSKLDTLYSADDTVHVGTFTLRSPGTPDPDRVVIARWPWIVNTTWDYSPDSAASITADSALGTYWNPTWLAAGASRTYTLAYGRGTSGAATTAVSPNDGPWKGGNTVMLSLPGYDGSTVPTVKFGTKSVTKVLGHGPGWMTVQAPAEGNTPTATAAPVRVTVADSSHVYLNKDRAYTYRGVAVVFIRGIASSFKAGQQNADPSDPFNWMFPQGTYWYLANRMPSDALHQFSYKTGSNDYECSDTFQNPAQDARNLSAQIDAIVANSGDVDLYLIGHSKGGVVALGYLDLLLASHRDPADLTAVVGGKTGHARLAGVVSMDSPLGGIDAGIAWLNWQADLQCLDASASLSVQKNNFMVLMSALRATASGQNSLGSHAYLGGILFPGMLAASNQDLSEAATSAGIHNGPAVLTVGNVWDDVFNLMSVDTWLSYTTQWMHSSAGSATYSRAIADKVGWIYLKWANHGLVQQNPAVNEAVWDLVNGTAPPLSDSLFEPPVNAPSIAQHTGGADVQSTAPAASVAIGLSGVVSSSGAGIANADVAAISTSSGSVVAGSADGTGAFALATPAGTYVLAVHDPAGLHPTGYAGPSGFTTSLADASRFIVTTGLVAADVQAPEGVAISGTATLGGASHAGVDIEALSLAGDTIATTQTAADSSYSLVVPAGSYLVKAVGNTSTRASAYYGSTGVVPDAASATHVAPASPGTGGINLDLPVIAKISGQVTDRYGSPLEGITVTASDASSGGVFSTLTQGDGTYSLPVDPGAYTMLFTDPAAVHVDGYFGDGGWTGDAEAAVALSVGFSSVDGVSVSLPDPGAPSAPSNVSAHHGEGGSAWIDWTEPASDGGTAVQSYVVLSSPGGFTCTAYAVPGCEVDGLTPGATYYFRTWAVNAAGIGPASPWSSPFVATGLPGIPGTPVATPGNASAKVVWSAPLDDGGAAITSYTVTSAPDGLTCTAVAPATTCTVTGLSYWSSYSFTVTATNSNGIGQPSDASSVIWPRDTSRPSASLPVARAEVSGAVNSGRIPIVVVPRGSDGTGSGIRRFQVERSTTGGRTWTSPISVLAGASYRIAVSPTGTLRFRARAIDWAGNISAWSTGPVFSPRLVQETTTSARWYGTWRRSTSTSFSGGAVKYSTAKSASVRYTFTGRAVALVATQGPSRGAAKVYVGSTLIATVDLWAPTAGYRRVVWQGVWGSSAARSIRVVVVGTSGRPRVDVDAFIVLR